MDETMTRPGNSYGVWVHSPHWILQTLSSTEIFEGSLECMMMDESRQMTNRNGDYHEYFIKVHLGNMMVTVNEPLGIATVKQEIHHEPFGMQLEGHRFENRRYQYK
jgi:hypothetical protein